jgi:hexosaminidase
MHNHNKSNFKKVKTFFLLLTLTISTGTFAQSNDPNMGIIPAPVSVRKAKGEFKVTPETMILVDSPSHKAVQFLAGYLKKNGITNEITDITRLDKKHPFIKNTITLTTNFKEDLPAEGYILDITGDQVSLKGRGAGLFYGVQTLIAKPAVVMQPSHAQP